MAMHDELRRIYRDLVDLGGLGGIDLLLRRSQRLNVPEVNRHVIEPFLKGEKAYTLQRPARRHYGRNQTYVAGIDAQWMDDLTDMQAISRQNKGARYLLTVIDVFSKFACIAPVKSKDAATVTEAFQQILASAAPCHMRRLQTDRGKECINSTFADLMKRHNILHFANEYEQKAAVIERVNRTIKTRIWTFFV